MQTALAIIEQPATLPALQIDLGLAMDFARASKSKATLAAYASDWREFEMWCEDRRIPPLGATPEAIASFIASQAQDGKKPSTLSRRLAAIRFRCKAAGLPNPSEAECVKATMSGIRRTYGSAPSRKTAMTAELVLAAVAKPGQGLQAIRDRALLLVGFAGAFRRSELIGLDVADITETPDGVLLHIRRSKVDQEGHGRKVAIPRGQIACPVAALQAWLTAAGITEGPIFRRVQGQRAGSNRLSSRIVADIVKAAAKRLGRDVATFAGHSLRAGLITTAARRGVPLLKITAQSGHASLDMLQVYCRDEQLFDGNAVAGLL